MFDEDGAIQALNTQAKLLRPEQPQPTMWQGFWKAAGGAIPAAINESARAAMAVAMNADFVSGQDSQEQRAANRVVAKETDQALRSGVEFWAPDPLATGTASQIVYDLGKTLTKVGAYAATGGLPGVAVGLSADEGINEAQRLQDAGVDPGTAAKAGGVRALTTAAGAAIPAFGKGIASTAGLVAASGPGSFVADQYAIKQILESADYAKKAQEYNPWDLTGLLVSTGVSAVIGGGGLYMRTRAATQQARERSRLGGGEDQSAMADAEAAARTMQTVEAMQAKALKPMEDLQGQIDHQNGMATAIRQMKDGEAVRVEDVVKVAEDLVNARMPIQADRIARSVAVEEAGIRQAIEADAAAGARSSEVEAIVADLLPDAGNRLEAGQVAEIKAQLAEIDTRLAQLGEQRKGRKGETQVEVMARRDVEVVRQELTATRERLQQQIDTNARATQAEQQIAALRGGDIPNEFAKRVQAAEKAAVKAVSKRPIADTVSRLTTSDRSADVAAPMRQAETPPQRASSSEVATERAQPASEIDAARMAVADSDLPVVTGLTPDGQPIVRSARELLEEAQATEQQAKTDAKAFKAAVLCAIGREA